MAVEATLLGQTLTEEWLTQTCEKFAWRATSQAASVIADLFQGVGARAEVQRFPGWLQLESQEFWHKALYIELAGECRELTPMTRTEASPTMHKRPEDSISSLLVIQRQRQQPNRLPIHNVKVYFPSLFTTQILENLPNLAVAETIRPELSLKDALSQRLVALGTAKYDNEQQFATLVLKGGHTLRPSLANPDVDTPLTRQAFEKGLFDATASANLGSAFGPTKVRLECRSANPAQFGYEFDPDKEWQQHTPTKWDVMTLSPAEALLLSSQACGVQIAMAAMRDTYGDAFVVKPLEKILHECKTLFPRDRKVLKMRNLGEIFEEPGFVTSNTPQHQFGEPRTFMPAAQWQAQLETVGVDTSTLASQTFKPWESAGHDRRQRSRTGAHRTPSRGTSEGQKGRKGKGQRG